MQKAKGSVFMKITDDEILLFFSAESTREKGFALLMEQYQERLYWVVRRMVNDHNDTDDVLQNVFIKVWKYLLKFKGNSGLYTWLYRIAINESYSFLKKKSKIVSISIENDENSIEQQLAADPYFSGDEIQLKLQAAITTLPDKQKAVFNMRYYDELTYEAIAEITGTSIGALKASYHHAVKKIEAHLIGR